MKLTAEQLLSIAWGAVRIQEEDGGLCLHRFTEEQSAYYERADEDFYFKSRAASGARLVFRTDSRTLSMTAVISRAVKRRFFAFEVYVDGTFIGSMDNYDGVIFGDKYDLIDLPWGRFSKEFALGDGEKTVMIYLPWAQRLVLEDISLEDGASLIPVRRNKTLMVYGDSITQGYDALWPSHRYTSRLADALRAEELSKAIGGEVFNPSLAKLKDPEEPDYILVSYGTNDWEKTTWEVFSQNCPAFFRTLCSNYPHARIFVLTPIWRKHHMEQHECGAFAGIADYIRQSAAFSPNVSIHEGFYFVPADETWFSDGRLHPNEKGIASFFENLWNSIQPTL